MTCRPSLAARSARPSPTRRLRSSDSTTQGPAMRNGAEPNCGVIASLVPAGELGAAPGFGPGAHVAVLASPPEAPRAHRVRARGPRPEPRGATGAHAPRAGGGARPD